MSTIQGAFAPVVNTARIIQYSGNQLLKFGSHIYNKIAIGNCCFKGKSVSLVERQGDARSSVSPYTNKEKDVVQTHNQSGTATAGTKVIPYGGGKDSKQDTLLVKLKSLLQKRCGPTHCTSHTEKEPNYTSYEDKEIRKIYERLSRNNTIETFVAILDDAISNLQPEFYLFVQRELLDAVEYEVEDGVQKLINYQEFNDRIHCMMLKTRAVAASVEQAGKSAVEISLDRRINKEIVKNMERYVEKKPEVNVRGLFYALVEAKLSSREFEQALLLTEKFPDHGPEDIFKKARNDKYEMPSYE